MDANAVEFVEICETEDLWAGEMMEFDVAGRAVLVLNVDGTFHAFDGTCPHQNVSLAEGRLDGAKLTCRAHEWEFDVSTACSINPKGECLKRHAIRIEDGKVFVAAGAGAV
jgi:nitrite reductase/ring-hydroxylating ferredoxin subunit